MQISTHIAGMSAFTALNGAEKPAEATIKVADQARPASAGRLNGQTPMTPASAIEPTKPGERDAWPAPTSDRQSHFQKPSNYAETENSHKRKRSDAEEGRREQPPPPPAQQDHSPREITARSAAHSEPSAAYEGRDREYRRYGDEPRPRGDEWYAGQSRDKQTNFEHQQSQRQSHQPQASQPTQTPPARAQSDEPGSERNRQEQSQGRMDAGYPGSSPDLDDRSPSAYATSPHGVERKDTGVIQVDPKKRKRNFSNRTKTGCMTCRKRKKKCDEQKPECMYPEQVLDSDTFQTSLASILFEMRD